MRRKKKTKKEKKISAEEEVYLWNEDNPADKPGVPFVWDPENALTNLSENDMNPPTTKYKSLGKLFPEEHENDSKGGRD